MFKKIIATGAMLALFACSQIDSTINETNNATIIYSSSSQDVVVNVSSSSSEQVIVDVSSSSSEQEIGDLSSSSSEDKPSIVTIPIASLTADKSSEMFGTYAYVFTLKADSTEDLSPFWNVEGGCSVEKQDTKPAGTCQLPTTNAILQHNLTNQYSKLHYQARYSRVDAITKANALYKWNLTGEGDEAALGLNVDSNEVKNIEEMGITALNNIVGFEYKYAGGAHEFRIVSKTNDDFWYYEVPETPITTIDLTASPVVPVPESDYKTIVIPINELKGMGSYAETPFDISKAAKFLWAAKYNAGNEKNNKNSLVLYDFNAHVNP